MKRLLIVNADDANLTPGVTRAILECHDRGILSSTTLLVNLPLDEATVRALKRRPELGVGLHANLTLGRPVSKTGRVRSLLASGIFRRPADYFSRLPRVSEAAAEYRAQVRLFERRFGRLPTHLDTHHQMHDHPLFLKALLEVAAEFGFPVRRSRLFGTGSKRAGFRVSTTDYLFGNLTPAGHWRAPELETVLSHLPEGTSEIMGHPGIADSSLRAVSSFTSGREAEHRLFSSPCWRRLLHAKGIRLSPFRVL